MFGGWRTANRLDGSSTAWRVIFANGFCVKTSLPEPLLVVVIMIVTMTVTVESHQTNYSISIYLEERLGSRSFVWSILHRTGQDRPGQTGPTWHSVALAARCGSRVWRSNGSVYSNCTTDTLERRHLCRASQIGALKRREICRERNFSTLSCVWLREGNREIGTEDALPRPFVECYWRSVV
jgi:hypothetical protein